MNTPTANRRPPIAGAAYAMVLVALVGSLGFAMSGVEDPTVGALRLVPAPTPEAQPAAEHTTMPWRIDADGVVRPARVIDLGAPIAGRVVQVHPALEQGSVVPAGEVLWRVDESEYAARLRGARNRLTEALALADIERGRARAAAREWDALGLDARDADEQDRSIALREPQRTEAEARVEIARAEVALAEIELDRCTIRLGFDLEVLDESVEPGAWLEQGQPMLSGMNAGDWQIVVWLTPAQADDARRIGLDRVRAAVTVLGSSHEPIIARVVRWLPGETGRPQMRGLLLEADDDPTALLWSGARVDVTLSVSPPADATDRPSFPERSGAR